MFKRINFVLLSSTFLGLFVFTEGKTCLESTRPHLTRCDKYFQCVFLPSKSYVWVPKQCETGLIYEHSLKICVLPGDDWECNLPDEDTIIRNDENNVYGIKNLQNIPSFGPSYKKQHIESGTVIYDNSNSDEDTEDDFLRYSIQEISSTTSSSSAESSEKYIKRGNSVISTSDDEGDVDYSGDGSDEMYTKTTSEEKTDAFPLPVTASSDVSLLTHLQRLAQLIDNFRKDENATKTGDLRPDQLNSFLAQYNILDNTHTQLSKFDFSNLNRTEVPKDGKIPPQHIADILQKQTKLSATSMATTERIIKSTTPDFIAFHVIGSNATDSDTKIELKATGKKSKKPNGTGGYSNSQIVVNRPEGAVLFNVARPQDGQNSNSQLNQPPRLSEEMLKTVLELSKQLVSSSNQQQIKSAIPENNYLQPIVRPVFYTIPIHDIPIPIINNNQKIEKVENKPHQSEANPMKMNSYENSKTSNSKLLENSAISVTVTNSNPDRFNSNINQNNPSMQGYKQNANQQFFHNYNQNQQQSDFLVDSYGYKYNQNTGPYYMGHVSENNNQLPLYPPLTTTDPYPQYNFYSNQNSYTNNRPPFTQNFNKYQSQPLNSYNNPSMNLNNDNVDNAVHYNPQFYQQNVSPYVLQSYTPSYFGGNALSPHQQQTGLNGQVFPSIYNYANENNDNQQLDYEDDNEDDVTSSSSSTQVEQPLVETTADSDNNKETQSLLALDIGIDDGNNRDKVIKVGDTYLSFNTYKETILPLLQSNPSADVSDKISILPCSTGVRQQNTSDCTKYFLCNPKNGNVLPYSCPPYTAFNVESRICDAKTYSLCHPSAISNHFTIAENKRLQIEAQQALQDAKRVREQAIQAQNLAKIISMETQKVFENTRKGISTKGQKPQKTQQQPVAATNVQQIRPIKSPNRKTTVVKQTGQTVTTRIKRKRYRCVEPGAAVPDTTSVLHYYVCYRGANNNFKRQRMACHKGLMFCARSRMCTLPKRCVG